MTSAPYFSILVTAYERPAEVRRCLESCWAQTFTDFEVVVVDDGSRDETPAVLDQIADPRLRVVTHQQNRGIPAARATAVDAARGSWLVMLDSDWELLPGSLGRLAELIDGLEPGVRIIRSRLEMDGGTLSPGVTPDGVVDYDGRLEWLEAIAVSGATSDAGHCMHREVLAAENYPAGRRGAVETLWELDLAQREPSLWVSDVLGRQHLDAANSHTRAGGAEVVARLRSEAPDQQWMAETMLARHGAGLARRAPHYRAWLLEMAAREALLSGDRRAGLAHTRAAARAGASGKRVWPTLMLGLIGAGALARAKATGRGLRARSAVAGGSHA